MLFWHGLTEENLRAVQLLFSEKSVVGAMSGEYMLFRCTSCGNELDLTYLYGDPMMPLFRYKCECGNKGRFKLSAMKVHDLPRDKTEGNRSTP